MKSFYHCYSKNGLSKISSPFSELFLTGIQPLFAHNDRSVIKRTTDSTTSTASGQTDTTSGHTGTKSGQTSIKITTIGQTSTTSDQA